MTGDTCDWCGNPFGDEIVEDLLMDGSFCSDECLEMAESGAAKPGDEDEDEEGDDA